MVDLQYWIKAFLLSLLFFSQSTYADDCPIPTPTLECSLTPTGDMSFCKPKMKCYNVIMSFRAFRFLKNVDTINV